MLGALLALLGGACAPERGRPAPAVVRVELSRPPTRETRLLAELAPDPAWTTEADRSRVGPLSGFGERPFLQLEGRGPKRVRIPLGSSSAGVNRVEVELFVHAARAIAVLQGWSAGHLSFSASTAIRGAPDVQRVAFEVPYAARAEPAPDELELEFRWTPRVRLAGVRLLEEDWARRLPSDAGLVEIRGRARRAFGIASDAPLTGELVVPEGGELLVAGGVPEGLRLPGREPTLVLRLGDGAGARVERLALATGDGAAWTALRVPLSGRAGERLPLRLELEAGGAERGFAAVARPLVVATRARPATVVLISSDTHRYDHLGAARAGVALETPALDALALQGVFYEACVSTTNSTLPSHAALLTGVHPRDTRVIDNFTALADAAPTLAERFRDAGFATAAVVSCGHLLDAHSGLGQGFDAQDASVVEPQRAADAVDLALERLAELERAPLFLWVHVFDAHTPYEPPEEFDRRYYPAGRDPFDPALPRLAAQQLVHNDPELRDVELPRAQYRAEIAYLDRELGRLLAHPRLADAAVLFTGDHGESLGQHGIWWEHGGLYPDSVHVPLILRAPGLPAGRRVARPVRHTDAGRTLLDLAGLTGAEFPGRSLLETLARGGGAAVEPRFLLAGHGVEAAIHDGRWLLILNLGLRTVKDERLPHRLVDGVRRERHRIQLFDLAVDPGCLHDRASAEPARARELRRALVAWLAGARAGGWERRTAGDARTAQRLQELGYTDEGTERAAEAPWFDPECACEDCAALE